MSTLVHAAIITLAVAATARSGPAPVDPCLAEPQLPGCPPAERVVYMDRTPRDVGTGRTGGISRRAPAPPRLPQVPILADGPAELTIPSPLATTLGSIVTRADFANPSVAVGGDGGGPTGELAVDTPLRELVPLRPRYPESLRAMGVSGTVVAEFVVDSSGRVDEGTVRIVESSAPAFSDAVRATLRVARFVPGEVRGRRVRTLARRSYRFELAPARE